MAFGDFRNGLDLVLRREIRAVELSALRDRELRPLLASLDELPLSAMVYVSFHAPSGLVELSEETVTKLLRQLLPRCWPIIVHPDVISQPSLWDGFDDALCIENMDKRKPVGRTVAELQPFFKRFPRATFCFDIGHARQVDPSMTEAALLMRHFGSRLRQVHMSEVNSSSHHDPMSFTALAAFRKVADLVPADVPIILETVIPESQIEQQIRLAESVFERQALAS
ncbi:MAG: hypothetical protein L0228_18330 [Planctomycetes bacterium]|nr:hypothetical protein [Planctomycetota bacterium]